MKKIALVTGASGGIGKAIAMKLAQNCFDIIIHYRKNYAAALVTKQNIEKVGAKAYLVQADITKPVELQKMFSEIAKFTKKIDLLVNNAGFDYAKLIEEYTLDEMKYVIDVILIGKIAVTKSALKFLKKSKNPAIINIASRMGKEKTIPTIGAYGPAEAGVIKFTQCCALEFKDYNIRVNCVAPGLTLTDMTRNIFLEESGDDKKKAEEVWTYMANINPSHRVGFPEDIANVVNFLASKESFYINGETIGVNGGSNLV